MRKLCETVLKPVVILAVTSGVAEAQDSEQEVTLKQLVDQATVAMPISTTPATFLLGAGGESVPRLSSFRSFSTQIARAFDDTGEVVNAISAEIAPALALENLSWKDIVDSQFARTWARTTFSVATTPESDNEKEKSSVGVQSILYAPAMDGALLKAADKGCRAASDSSGLLKALGPPPVLPDEPTSAERQTYLKDLKKWESGSKALRDEARSNIESCQKDIDAILTKWNQPMVAVGLGKLFRSAQDDASAYWLTAAYGADFGKERNSSNKGGYLVTTHVRETSNVVISMGDDSSISGDERLIGINLKIGNPKFSFLAEYSVLDHDASADDRKRSVVGMEYKLNDDLYITMGVGRDSGAGETQQSIISGLKWGIGKTPSLGIGGS